MTPAGSSRLLGGRDHVQPELADLGPHVGRVVVADRMVVGDRPPAPDDRLARGGLPPARHWSTRRRVL